MGWRTTASLADGRDCHGRRAATTLSDGQGLKSLEVSQKVLCGLEEMAKSMLSTQLQFFLLYTNSNTFSSRLSADSEPVTQKAEAAVRGQQAS